MQVKSIVFIALLAVVAVALCGCSTVTPSPTAAPAGAYPMTVADNYNRTATLNAEPQRIVSMSAANTEMLFDLGLGGKIVGVDDYSDYPAEAKNITKTSGYSTVNYEKITAVSPDLIVAEDVVTEQPITKLRDMGFQVIELKNSNMTQIRNNIALLGKATNTSANATALIADIDKKLADISAKTASLNDSQKPNVLLLTGFSEAYPEIFPFGADTYGDELLKLTGGRNAAQNVSLYASMGKEAIVDEDPDYVIIPVDGVYCTISDYYYFKNGTAAWMQGLSAVKNGKVFMVDGNLFLRPGPRAPEAGLELARVIHPELFQ